MRLRFFVGAMLAAMTAVAIQAPVHAQGLGDYYVPSTPMVNAHLPTGNPGGSGFYTAMEFFYFQQTRTLQNQVIARRGFIDAGGLITGQPGTFVGSGATALQTDDFGRQNWMPGWGITIGYKSDNGMAVYGRLIHTPDITYTAGATFVGRNFRGNPSLSDGFITADVFNFPSDYAGPIEDTAFDRSLEGAPGGNTYGLWNAAEEMTIRYRQRFVAGDIGVRMPAFETEMSRVYGLAGLRYSWFFERFVWRTVDRDVDGIASPSDSAQYTNTLSQRMYGPFLGCGHEVYFGKAFALGVDVSAGALLGFVKERIKYELGDPVFPTQNKRSMNEFRFVPNINADLNLTWYPIQGVQARLGYTTMQFFNTSAMKQPVTFDFGNLNPHYGTQSYRLVHGVNIGLAFFF